MSAPEVAVVVATRERPRRLAALLDALEAQTLPRQRFEVIVACDGAAAPTLEVLCGRGVEIVRLETPRGPAGARNTGWRASSAAYVAFTDDDCRPDAHWLERLLARAGPRRIVQGRTLPDPADAASAGLLSRTVTVERMGPQYETCNILYPRSVLERLGGFDERYGFTPGGEDTDLAWRAIASGCHPVLADGAVVLHAVERIGARGRLRVAARWSATVRIFGDHPQTRVMLWRGVFWNVWHYLLWRSVLALTLPPPLRRLVLARHLEALRRRAREEGARPEEVLWAVPFLLLHDGVECAAILRGALRHRVLVL